MDTFYLNHLNWLAIGAAAVAYFMLGALWYSLIFKNAWIRLSGVDMSRPDAKKGAGAMFLMTLVLEFVACTGIAILAYKAYLLGGGFTTGIKLGLVTGICFASIAVAISYLYQMKSKALILIDCGYHVVGNIIAAIIICMWVK